MSTASPSNLYENVMRHDVEIAVRADKGEYVQLESYEVVEFTSKGDNHTSLVCSLEVKYSSNGKCYETSYVMKINTGISDLCTSLFVKETGFFKEIIPELNFELDRAGQPPLKLPKCFHFVRTPNKEIIFMEDLRRLGFKMHARQSAFDKSHTDLIIKELARLHAAGYLFISRRKFKADESFAMMDPCVKEIFNDPNVAPKVSSLFSTAVQTTAKLVKEIPGYEYVHKYVENNKDNVLSNLMKILKPSTQFNVILHGDCWNSNFLFRYSSDGVPIDCRLLDLQSFRIGSPGNDLSNVLYTSTDGPNRRSHLQGYLETYYAHFASTISAANQLMPITLDELKKDYSSKKLYGMTIAMMFIPTMLLSPKDIPEMWDFTGDNSDIKMAEYSQLINERLRNSSAIRPRLLDMLDEMEGDGVFNTDDNAEV